MQKEFAYQLNKSIITQRLILEPLMAEHADILFDSLCDERIYRWIEAGEPKDLSELRSKWQRNEARLSPDGNDITIPQDLNAVAQQLRIDVIQEGETR